MPNVGLKLLDGYIARATDLSHRPVTRRTLITKCLREIEWSGRSGKIELYLPGKRGRNIKRTRRLFPQGPVGEILFAESTSTLLLLEFSVYDILESLGEGDAARRKLAEYLLGTGIAGRHTNLLPIGFCSELAAALVPNVEIEADLLERIHYENAGISMGVISSLLWVNTVAQRMRWDRVCLAQWGKRSVFGDFGE